METELQIVTELSFDTCVAMGEGFIPPSRDEYADTREFEADLERYWAGWFEQLEAAGISWHSILLAGCLPEPFLSSEAELIELHTRRASK